MYTVGKGGGMGVIGVEGLRQIKYLPQSPFTGQFFLDNDNSIAFYQSKLSTRRRT
jgi:hypothetical protein